MHDLTIPKRVVQLEVKLTGGEWQTVETFLAEVAEAHHGPERIEDLLNGKIGFLPVRTLSKRTIHLLSCNKIVLVRPLTVEPLPDADDLSTDEITREEVDLIVEGGERLRGVIEFSRPPNHSRLMDFMNESTRFFRFLSQRGLLLVNKQQVLQVEFLPDP